VLPETFFTVWTNIFDRGRLKAGERILIHGGSSGIGTTAIQLAKAFGAHVTITAGSKAKCDACLALGADEALNYHEQDFTRITPVNLILDMVGGSYFERNLQCLAPEGRLLQIAHLQGRQVQLDLAKLMQRRLTLTGSTLRPRSPEEKAAIARALETHVWPLLSAGKIRPVIYRTFPIADYLAAHDLMESNQHIGKIVLIVDSTLHPQP
jgi:NADPH2:quinone reductase